MGWKEILKEGRKENEIEEMLRRVMRGKKRR